MQQIFSNRFQTLFWFCTFLLFASSCANIVTPSGGPKDTAPPRYIKSDPPQPALNFKEKKIRIWFNEFINLEDITNQIIVSPPPDKDFTYNLRGKSVVIGIEGTLKDSATYNINFGESLKDITEGNPLSGFSYVFSTGNSFDTLSLKGTVIDAFSLEAVKGALIMLYSADNDSLPYLKKPEFAAKTDATGQFIIRSLPAKNFKMIAVSDKDNNMLLEPQSENIAFSDTMVIPQFDAVIPDSLKDEKLIPVPALVMHKLRMFQQADTIQAILKSRSENHAQFRIYFKRPVAHAGLMPLNPKSMGTELLKEINFYKDTLTCWLLNPETDTVKYAVFDQGKLIDTVEIAIKPKSVDNKNKQRSGKGTEDVETSFRLKVLPSLVSGNKIPFYSGLTLSLSHPIAQSDFSDIKLFEVKDSLLTPVDFIIKLSDSIVNRRYELLYKWDVEKTYRIQINPGAFTDIYDLQNDSLINTFTVINPESYGKLLFTFYAKDFSCNYIIQLLNEAKKTLVEKTVSDASKIVFENLNPGNYNIRIIRDSNNNGKWDTGDYLKKIQPETILMFPNPISIRANWDTEYEYKE